MSHEASIWALRLAIVLCGWDLGLKARILALKLGLRHPGRDLCLKDGVYASSPGFDGYAEGGGEEEEVKA